VPLLSGDRRPRCRDRPGPWSALRPGRSASQVAPQHPRRPMLGALPADRLLRSLALR